MTIALLVVTERLSPRAPAPLVAVAGAIGAVSLLGLQTRAVHTVGHVPPGLPGEIVKERPLVKMDPEPLWHLVEHDDEADPRLEPSATPTIGTAAQVTLP